MLFLLLMLFNSATPSASAADLLAKKAILKIHQHLYAHCISEKVSCSAFPSQEPQRESANPTEQLKQIQIKSSADLLADKLKGEKIQKQVVQEVPEAKRAYEILAKEFQNEVPTTHEAAVAWISKNALSLQQGLQKTKEYTADHAYSFAKLNIMMRFIYNAMSEGTVTQKDLDAKFEVERAGYQIANLLTRHPPTIHN